MKNIAILITCHNRKEKTIQCLEALFFQNGLGEQFNIEVFLVDDGCTDGTPEAISQNFQLVNNIIITMHKHNELEIDL